MKSHRMTALALAAGMAGIAMIGIAGCGQPGPASGAARRASVVAASHPAARAPSTHAPAAGTAKPAPAVTPSGAASGATGASLATPAAQAGAVRTKTHIYEAFTATGKAAIHITKTMDGSCYIGSFAAARDDAWRCLSGNDLYDPCFSSDRAKGIVLCVVAPWQRSGVKIKLTKPLPKPYAGKPSTSGLPWGIETTAGLKCVFATGGTTAIGGVRANYGCATSKEWLWGSPSRKLQPWTIYIAPFDAKKLSTRAKIAVAWF
jgi:hypothetical protein